MRISDILSVCWRNLSRRKLRTFLTALGIIIGVFLIILIFAFGLGLSKGVDEQMAQWGDLTVIEVYGGRGGMVSMGGGSTSSDAGALNDAAIQKFQEIEGVEVATAFYNAQFPFTIRTKNGRYETQWVSVYGISPGALEKFGYEIGTGKTLEEGDKEYSIVVGEQFAYNFRDTKRKRNDTVSPWPDPRTGIVKKPFLDPQKEKLFLYSEPQKEGAKPLEVQLNLAGIMKISDARYESRDSVFIDISELKLLQDKYNKLNGIKKTSSTTYNQVKVKCFDMEQVAAVQKQIEEMGFGCSSMESYRQSMQEQTNMIQWVLGGIAAVSLLVAAIGGANTMYMSVVERTREIGIMKVIGAKIGNIRTMFLLEAGMIGLFGGAMGVLLSFLAAYGINRFAASGVLPIAASSAGLLIIPAYLVVGALLFSLFIGVLFGFLPANRAVKISALEAIKHD